MVSAINIRRDEKDPFYRYKMEPLQSKIEGQGNGIKTVIVNLSSVAQSLSRPPAYLIKYFGFELGAQTNLNPADDRWIVNGAHDARKLQDYLDGFINKFVLCKSCKNPETVVQIKGNDISLDCKACGERTTVDPRLKLSSFVIKQNPKKGKKDKSTKKAERKARKAAQANGQTDSINGEQASDEGSPDGSNHNSDRGDVDGDLEMDAGSDDELTRRINAEAKDLGNTNASDEKDIKWSVDTSEEAMKKRAQELPDDLKKSLVINGDDEGEGEDENSPYAQLGNWLDEQTKSKGGVSKVGDVEIYKKAQELGIEKRHKTLTVLAQSIFDERIVNQIDGRAGMLKKMIDGKEKNEKAFLGGTERFVGLDKPKLIPNVSAILIKYYENDIVSEEVLKAWGGKASKHYVDMTTSKKVRKSAEKFMTWLEQAESEDDSDDE